MPFNRSHLDAFTRQGSTRPRGARTRLARVKRLGERSWLFNPELPDGFAARVTANNVVNLRCKGCGAVTVPFGVSLELLQLAAEEFLALGFHRFADACERERKRLESLESDDVSDRVRHFPPVPARVW